MEIGNKLKCARKEKGLTQEQAAEALGVSRQTISNWENGKSYPDIMSVIKMSDLYSISLDPLLKEEKTVKQTYQEFLEESTDQVKAKRKLGNIILLAVYFLVWAIVLVVFWCTDVPMYAGVDYAFRWTLLPLVTLGEAMVIGKNGYYGKVKGLCVLMAAVTYLVVPDVRYVVDIDMATYTFLFPNFGYMLAGTAIAACGMGAGMLWNRLEKKQAKEN